MERQLAQQLASFSSFSHSRRGGLAIRGRLRSTGAAPLQHVVATENDRSILEVPCLKCPSTLDYGVEGDRSPSAACCGRGGRDLVGLQLRTSRLTSTTCLGLSMEKMEAVGWDEKCWE
jgi:hypothetical protein